MRPTLPLQASVLPPSVPTCLVYCAVVDFAQRGHHLRAGLRVHRQDRAEVLEREDAKIADFSEQAALGALGLLLFDVPLSNPAGVRLAACTTCGSAEVALRISVFAELGGAISASQTGSPGR